MECEVCYDSLWSMKYLHRHVGMSLHRKRLIVRFVIRFKWSHLTEQMNLEKIQRDQRLRSEMGRAGAAEEEPFKDGRVNELKRRKRLKDVTGDEAIEATRRTAEHLHKYMLFCVAYIKAARRHLSINVMRE